MNVRDPQITVGIIEPGEVRRRLTVVGFEAGRAGLRPPTFRLMEIREVRPDGVLVEQAGMRRVVPIEQLTLAEVLLVGQLLPPVAADRDEERRRRPPPGTVSAGLPGMEVQARFAAPPPPRPHEPTLLERERERLVRARAPEARQDVLQELDRFEGDKKQRRLV